MIPIISIIVTTLLTSWVAALLNDKFNINIQGFSMIFVIPVGSILVGLLATSGLAIGRKIDKSTIKNYYLAYVLLSGVLVFFMTTYFDYLNVMKTAENTIRQEYSALSSAEKQDVSIDEIITNFRNKTGFMDYLKKIHEESVITISSRRGKSAEINNGIVSMVSFWVSVLGAAFGGWLMLNLMIGSRTKDKHGEYRDLKYMSLVEYGKYDDVNSILSGANIGGDFSEFISENPHSKANQTKSHTSIIFLVSRKDEDGQIIIEQKTPSGNNQFTSDRKEVFDISSSDAKTILSKLKEIGIKNRI